LRVAVSALVITLMKEPSQPGQRIAFSQAVLGSVLHDGIAAANAEFVVNHRIPFNSGNETAPSGRLKLMLADFGRADHSRTSNSGW
jgi:hypothetical protein